MAPGPTSSCRCQISACETVSDPPAVSDTTMLALYGSSAELVMSYTKEGFGIVFAEAATSSPPVIGCNQESSLDLLADGRIGRAIDPKSPGQIMAALNDAMEGRLSSNPREVHRCSFPNFASHVHELVRTFAR
jgi:glycosyltransferase involved in cell wall biosynthesis